MGKLTEKYNNLFEGDKFSNWKSAYNELINEANKKFSIDVKPVTNKKWSIEFKDAEKTSILEFLNFINNKFNYKFVLEDDNLAIYEDFKLLSEADEEEEVEDDEIESEEENEDGIPVEMDVIEEEPEFEPELGAPQDDMLQDVPGEEEAFAMDDFTSFKSKKEMKGAMDSDSRMAQSQLSNIKDHVDSVSELLGDEEDLPAWVQQKITLAAAYIDEIYHRLKH